MTGLPIEKQAQASVLLDEKVKELVRKHLKEALEDYRFITELQITNLASRLATSLHHDSSFNNAVKSVIITQMQKY